VSVGIEGCKSNRRRLQLVAAGQQFAIARRQVTDDMAQAMEETLGSDSRARGDLLGDEVVEGLSDP